MMNEQVKFRQELKYLINHGEMHLVKQRINGIMKKDEHTENGFYKIRSLYFDDYWNTAYAEKVMGVHDRQKYRIRIYNDSDSIIKLERKRKAGSSIHKSSASLTREETLSLINGDYRFLLKKEDVLCKEFYYQCVSKVMRPCVIVDYEREPYVFEAGDVRVTFDTNVRASTMFREFFNPALPSTYVIDEGKLIMEVKYTELLPSIIRNALPGRSHEFAAFSKFTMCFEKTSRFSPLIVNGVSQI